MTTPRHRTVPLTDSITRVGKGYPDKLVIFRLPASSYWWVRYWTQNKMVKKSTKTPRKNEAIQFAKKFYEDILLRERNLLPVTKSPTTEIFGLVAGSEIVVGNRTKALAGSRSGQLSPIIIEPPALIIAQGFEGTIFEGEVANPFTDIPRKLDSQEIVYPNGERVRLSLLKAEEDELQRSAFSNEITPIRARFAHSEDRLKDIDVWINAQRMQFLSAIENSDKDTIWQMIADGFNPTAEYSGENFKEIPQLFCKDVKTYKLLESLNAVVAVSSESTETIQAIKAYASGNLGLEVLRYIADQDGSLNSDWDGIDGRLAIHAAVATGDLEAVRAIVSAGADIHLASNDRETALGLALNQESSGIVTYLLSQGASLSAEDYRHLELEGGEVAPNHPRDGIRSAEMAMLVRQYEVGL